MSVTEGVGGASGAAERRHPAVRVALRSPGRFLLSAWPLRCWLHVLGGVLFGAVVLALLVAAVSLGVVLSAVGVGLLVLAAVPPLGIRVAAVERRRLRLVEPAALADPHEPPPPTAPGGGCATGSGNAPPGVNWGTRPSWRPSSPAPGSACSPSRASRRSSLRPPWWCGRSPPRPSW